MVILIVGLLIFFGVHLVSANGELRDGLVTRFGAGAYKGVYSLVSLLGFVVIVLGYHKMQEYTGSKNPILWYPPGWTRHAAMTLMLPVFVLLVAAYVPSRIRGYVKHPMLLAVKLWALAHLLANGTAAALVLFLAFLAYAVVARISLKRRGIGPPASDSDAPLINDAFVVAVGFGLYALMLMWGHGFLIGKPLVS